MFLLTVKGIHTSRNKAATVVFRYFVLLAALIAAGCATVGNLAILDQSKREQVKVGTTKAEVTELVGSPTMVYFGPEGQETWSYHVSHAEMNPAAMLPVVGLFANSHNVQSTSLIVMFGDDGKVQKFAFTEPQQAKEVTPPRKQPFK